MNAEKGSYTRILFGAQWECDDWKLSASGSRQAQDGADQVSSGGSHFRRSPTRPPRVGAG